MINKKQQVSSMKLSETFEHKSVLESNISQILDLLSEDEKNLIEMFYLLNCSVKEIAQHYNVAEITIKTRKRRALDKLKISLTNSK